MHNVRWFCLAALLFSAACVGAESSDEDQTDVTSDALSTSCAAGVWTQVAFYVNPFWFMTPRIQVFGTPSFTYRWYGTAFPFYFESGLINGSWSDVLIPPSVGTTLEIR